MPAILTWIFFCLLPLVHLGQKAQYWVYYADKGPAPSLAVHSFDPVAIENRKQLGIPFPQLSDFPVWSGYSSRVQSLADSLLGDSRWLNASVVVTSPPEAEAIASLPFVVSVVPAHVNRGQLSGNISPLSRVDSTLLRYQTGRLHIDAWQEAEIDGKGIRIGVIDAGFKGVDDHPAFRHLFEDNRLLATYDFLREDSNVYRHHTHGTAVLGCIAGWYGDIPVGMATGASFVLARTERGWSEWRNEELSWIQALEWMDRKGVRVVNSSLGYGGVRYFQEEMDGRSPIARAGNMAARKGILVVNAAGNEAVNRWGTIVTPADGDSILAVGGTNPYTDVAIDFSSPGPSSDGRVKPNVCAPGEVVSASAEGFSNTFGTSFSAPLVTGFAACLLQWDPTLKPMELLRHIERSGHLYPYYDYHHGYGIPLADKALGLHVVDSSAFTIKPSGDYINFMVAKKYLPAQDSAGHPLSEPNKLYLHVEQPDGMLKYYKVIEVVEEEGYFIEAATLNKADILRVHFQGLTKTYRKP